MLLPFTFTSSTIISSRGIARIVLGLLFWLPLTVQAADIETLVMPGPVVQGHAEYETQCTQCHGRFSNQDQRGLCLDCHEIIAADVSEKSGFHGRESSISGECSQCHTEHKGRTADIVGLSQSLFDHRQTDFALEGRHVTAECHRCHSTNGRMPGDSGRPVVHWRDAPSDCFACHESDDAHQQRLGKQCDDCHTSASWQQQEFDHDTTRFALHGAHAETLCAACHPNQRYKNIPTDCASCHGSNDIHQGAYGDQCQQCHNNRRWDQAPFAKPYLTASRFDHSRTDFALEGEHAQAACSSCHAPGQPADQQSGACVDCHRSDDVHRTRNGNQCHDCHSADGWSRSKFDHDTDTDFPLHGSHQQASCNSCHANGVDPGLGPRTCVDCHRSDDIHRNELGEQCEQCHEPSRWFENVRFDHDLTGMPLYGMHALADCQSCHTDGSYKPEAISCVSCHRNDDHHERTLGQSCEQCHNPNGWAWWQFDHDNTDFPLTGSHEGLTCKGCHQEPLSDGEAIELSNQCGSCHRQDDAHNGGLGMRCERCHNTEDFAQPFTARSPSD